MYHIHKYTCRFLFLLSIAIILYATLYREAGQGDIELHLFWTIKRAWSEHSGYYWYLILGNIVLFMPFGFFSNCHPPKAGLEECSHGGIWFFSSYRDVPGTFG